MAVSVTGTFILPNGEVAANRLITMRRSQRGVVAQGLNAVLPDDVTVASDNTGQVEFDLVPGNYVGFARTANGLTANFTLAVPDVASVDIADVINADAIPEASQVSELQAQIDALQAAVDAILAGGGVTPVAPSFTVMPTLLGSTAIGGTVTVDFGSASGVPAPVLSGVLSRPGQADAVVSDGQVITVVGGDQGGDLVLTVTAANSVDSLSETATLAVPVSAVAPAVTTEASITGGDTEGEPLTANVGAASGVPTPTFSRQWLADGIAVSGQTGATFDTTGYAGQSISVRVTWTNGVGEPAVSTSNAIDVVSADNSAQRVILLTDYAGDCDDTPAVLIAADAHDKGDINLLGIVATSTVATSAPGVYGQLAAYGMTNIPVYAYQGSVGTYNNRISAPVRDRFGVAGQTRTAFTDDVTGLRTMLAAAPDGSVKMIDVGAPVSTSRLLESPADAISPLTGRQLVAAKVVGLWMMAGEFTSTRVEYNADRDVASTQNVYQTWPTPIYAHGAEVGATILTGPMVNANPLIDPVKVAFDAMKAAAPSAIEVYLGRDARSSWDPACVHHAIYGNQNLYNLAGANGTISVSGTGVTSWSATPAGNKSYVGKVATDAVIAAAIQTIIDNTGVLSNPNASVPAQVTQPSVNGTTSTRVISWTAPANGGSPILSYTVRRNGVTAGTVPGNVLSFTIESIPEGTHQVTVSATNQRGEGPQSPVREFTVAPAGTVTPTNVAWPLQEGSGVAISRTGTQADLVGPVWEATPTRITFNGTSSYAFSPPPAVAERGTDYVLSALVRMTNVTGARCILSRNGNVSATTRVFQFRSNGGALEFVSSTDAGASVVVSAPAGTVPINTWVLVSAYVTLTGVELRANGVVVATGAFPAENRSSAINNIRYEWGCRVNSTNGTRVDFMAGSMAAVAIVNSATAQTLPAVELEMRGIAADKGIALP